MNSDPYGVLGISRNASDDEIKKKYRELSRKYHPDANINNPNKDQAEKMFKDVQQAYQQIMDERTKGYSSTDSQYGSARGNNGDPWGFGDFWGFGGFTQNQNRRTEYEDDDTRYMKAVANYINSGSYNEAYNLLQSINRRNAEWYYYSAIANAGLGNNVVAKEHASQACSMDPNNINYQRLARQLESGGNWYAGQSRMYGNSSSLDNKCCLGLLLGNVLCNSFCCGRGLCI